jgi:hypothetical protein
MLIMTHDLAGFSDQVVAHSKPIVQVIAFVRRTQP